MIELTRVYLFCVEISKRRLIDCKLVIRYFIGTNRRENLIVSMNNQMKS